MVKSREFTGKHAAFVFIGGFIVIIIANLALTFFAVGTFPGLDTKNAYVDSQEFNKQKAAQERLGWQSDVEYRDGQVILILKDKLGNVPSPSKIKIRVGRATTSREDAELDMRFNGQDYVAAHELGKGKWLAFLEMISADGTFFRQTHEICVESCPSIL